MTTPPEPPRVGHTPDNRCPADILRRGHLTERCRLDVGHDGPCQRQDGSKWPIIVSYQGIPVPENILGAWQSTEASWWRSGVIATIRHYEGK